ncbi:MAG TPA: ABC transporter permease [Armatimonadota bacterium]|nr:ABC transporter permease [Armatimonadota bacterium]
MADKKKNGILAKVQRFTDHREFMIFYIIVLGVIAMAYAIPGFMSHQNMSAVLLALADQSIIAIGMTLLLVSGGFDMSVGSTMALAGATTAIWLTLGLPVPVAILLGLAVGALIGAINGYIIAEVGINPFITTLGMMSLARGMLMVVSDGKNISGLPDSFTVIGQGSVFGIQYPIIISIVLVAGGDFLLRRSRFFRQNYYMGANEKAAVLSGINVKKMKVFNYALTGLLAALAGIIITARLGSASTSAGKGLELRVISAVIIGGASLKGGVGTVFGSFLGALLMAIIVSSINLLGVQLNWIDFVLGATLLLAVMADTFAARRKG